jgi:hypothetical protein
MFSIYSWQQVYSNSFEDFCLFFLTNEISPTNEEATDFVPTSHFWDKFKNHGKNSSFKSFL